MRITSLEERAAFRHLWVLAEQRQGCIQEVTFELLTAGRELADQRGCELWCVLLGHQLQEQVKRCFAYGADRILLVDDQALAVFNDLTYANTLIRLINKYRPEIVLAGATAAGRSVMPRVAGSIEAGLTADCTELSLEDGTGLLLQTRPAFGGNIMATIKCADHLPQMATVRPRVMTIGQEVLSRTGEIVSEPFIRQDSDDIMRILKTEYSQSQVAALADAHIIVSGGRGVKGQKGFALLNRLACLLGGAVGATRAAVDSGWIDYAQQVGQTGQTVQPRIYIACGISGQVQHLVGMQSADLIIAINADPEAPLMQMADYAIVGDLFEVIPALVEEMSRV